MLGILWGGGKDKMRNITGRKREMELRIAINLCIGLLIDGWLSACFVSISASFSFSFLSTSHRTFAGRFIHSFTHSPSIHLEILFPCHHHSIAISVVCRCCCYHRIVISSSSDVPLLLLQWHFALLNILVVGGSGRTTVAVNVTTTTIAGAIAANRLLYLLVVVSTTFAYRRSGLWSSEYPLDQSSALCPAMAIVHQECEQSKHDAQQNGRTQNQRN